MTIDTGEFKPKHIVCTPSGLKCIEYISKKSAISYAQEEAKKTHETFVVSEVVGKDIDPIGLARPDGSFEELKISEAEERETYPELISKIKEKLKAKKPIIELHPPKSE